MTGTRGAPWLDRAPLLLAAGGVALLVLFDLGTAVPFNDEFIYQWVLRRLVQGHGFHPFPGQIPLGVIQVVVAAAVSGGTADPHIARLTGVPFVVGGCVALYRIARHLEADRFWSGVAAAAPLAMPVFAGSATGFMTEPYYLGLLMPAALFACRWVRGDGGVVLTVVLCALGVLERQHAAAIAPAMTVGLLVASRARRVERREWAGLGALWMVALAALVVPLALGLRTDQMRQVLADFGHPTVAAATAPLFYLPGMVGLATLPFAAGLAPRAAAAAGTPWWRRRRTLVAGGILVLLAATTFMLPGNYLTRAGLNPVTVAGDKPRLFEVAFPLVGVLALGAFGILLARPWRSPQQLFRDPRVAFLLALGALAMVPLFGGVVLDRYYLPVLLPILPVVAVLAGHAGWPRVARGWALAALLGGIGLYAAGEQDYQAWQVARAQAELAALRLAPAGEIFSGFEPYSVDAVLPYYERNGRLPDTAHNGLAMTDPAHRARVVLLIAPADDPRPGFAYRSLAPGRVVVACPQGPCATGPGH